MTTPKYKKQDNKGKFSVQSQENDKGIYDEINALSQYTTYWANKTAKQVGSFALEYMWYGITHFGEENDNLLQYSCLENFMNRGTWYATVHGITKTQTHSHKQSNALGRLIW